MEFIFLLQNVSLEIVVLILLGIVIITITSYNSYIWWKHVWKLFFATKREKLHPHIDSWSIEIPHLPIEEAKKEDIEEENTESHEKIDTSHVEKLVSLVSSIRTLIARGMITEARTLIVEGLSIEKNHRDLNLLLGSIYEQEGQFEKAEYIYKDLAEIDPDDVEILEKLANVLIIEKKNVVAYEIYKKIHTFTGNTETTLYMLTHISNTLHDDAAIVKYAKQYMLQWPKNPEIVTLLAQAQINLGKRKDAIESYKHLKNLTPYSSEISETLQKLLLEEELANNFKS